MTPDKRFRILAMTISDVSYDVTVTSLYSKTTVTTTTTTTTIIISIAITITTSIRFPYLST